MNVVSHNLLAMNANRQLNITTKYQAKSTEKLSSGYKINRAADDAAGLSISEKMRKQIRGLDRASQNAEDGISMVQIADGAMSEVNDMLQRLNELCVQAANGTNSDSDRQSIQDEVDQLKKEIDRIATTTKFNETYLLDGGLADASEATKKQKEFATFVVNGRAGNGFESVGSLADIEQVSGTKLVYSDVIRVDDVVTTQTGGGNMLDGSNGITNISGKLVTSGYEPLKNTLKTEIVPQAVNAIMSTYSNALNYLNESSIGIGLALYKDAGSSTLASVTAGGNTNKLNYQLSVNIATLSFNPDGSLTDASRNALEVTIIHEMTHAFMDESLTNGMLFGGADRFPSWFAEGMAQTSAGGMYNGNDWVKGLGILPSTSTTDIKTKLAAHPISNSSDSKANYGTGYLASMYLGWKVNGGGQVTKNNLAAGVDKLWSDIEGNANTSPMSLEDVIKANTSFSSLSDFQTGFASSDEVAQFIHELVSLVGEGTGGLVAGFDNENGILPDSEGVINLKLFQLDTDHNSVANVYPAGYNVVAGGSATGKAGGAGYAGDGGGYGYGGGIASIAIYKMKVFDGHALNLHVGSDADMNNKIAVNIDGINCDSIGIGNIDVTTENNATDSINFVGFAIKHVSAERSRLGAIQNRLEHTVNNLDNVVENTTAAESRIRDTDMAEEMVTYSKNNILAQAGQSMLAQANQSSQGILTLLQ